MRKLGGVLACLAVLVPAVAALVAVASVPSSAFALPVFEISTGRGALRLSAAEFGARRSAHGLDIDRVRFEHALAALQQTFRTPAQPTTYELNADHTVLLHPGASGVELDPTATRALLLRALRGAASDLKLPTRTVAAPPAPEHAIVVRLSDFRLDLYDGPRAQRHFAVGVGRLSFPTPPGAYYVKWKDRNPTWINPGSSWARYMPHYIAPGPRNPLGTRALRLDRGALVIHGTPEPWSIGQRSSHGCIRMRREDVEQLFDLVPPGTPVFIVP